MDTETKQNQGGGEVNKTVDKLGENTNSRKNDGIVEAPYKSDVFELYVLWSSLPAFFKRPPKDRKTGTAPEPREFVESMGIDDPVILDLVEIRFQQDFAKRYNVGEQTLSEWNKTIEKRDLIGDVKVWGKKLLKNVVASMYSNSLSTKNLNADRDRLNFLKFVGWEEKSEVTHRVVGLVDEVKKQINAREQTALPAGGEDTRRPA